MSNTAMIVGVISVIGALFLVSSNSQFRQLGLSKGIKLALIWAVIIVGLVLTIQLFGIQSRS
jgi:c-di-GMP-related signal transduction protein